MNIGKAQEIARKKIKIHRNCEKCGSKKNLVRHHEDYDKPEDVIILCKKCHSLWHKDNKAKNKGNILNITVRIPVYLYKKMENKKKQSMYSINLQIVEAIKKDKEIQKYG